MWQNSRIRSRCFLLALGHFALFQNGWLAPSQFVCISFNNLCSTKSDQSPRSGLPGLFVHSPLPCRPAACWRRSELLDRDIETLSQKISRWLVGAVEDCWRLRRENRGNHRNKIKPFTAIFAAVAKQISSCILSSLSPFSPSPLLPVWPARGEKKIYLVKFKRQQSWREMLVYSSWTSFIKSRLLVACFLFFILLSPRPSLVIRLQPVWAGAFLWQQLRHSCTQTAFSTPGSSDVLSWWLTHLIVVAY